MFDCKFWSVSSTLLLIILMMSNNPAKSTVPLVPTIVNGTNAQEGEAPFQVQLRQNLLITSQFFCGGSLVAPRTVVTAAHCVSNPLNNLFLRVRYGTLKLNQGSPFGDHLVTRVSVHPRYNARIFRNDIAVVNLLRPIQPSANLGVIQLQTEELPSNSSAKVFGWGRISGQSNQLPDTLQMAELDILSEQECEAQQQQDGLPPTNTILCASQQGRAVCNGDSGGPLVSSDGRLAGVVSADPKNCPEGSVNLFTKVSSFVDFINRHTY